jgi:hypothetical protein
MWGGRGASKIHGSILDMHGIQSQVEIISDKHPSQWASSQRQFYKSFLQDGDDLHRWHLVDVQYFQASWAALW